MAFTTSKGSAATDVVTLIGTDGRDLATITTQASGLFLDAKEADDQITFSEAGIGYNARGMSGDDIFSANSSLTSSIINGNIGDDEITTGAELVKTSIYGGKGVDTITSLTVDAESALFGNIGADVITVTSGMTSGNVYGGKDVDTITVGGFISASGIFGDIGADVINLTSANLNAGSVVNGGQNEDVITLAGVNTFSNSASVFGGQGNDTINGANSLGNQILFGDLDNDTITSGTGADNLTGGVGTDSLTGGTGADTFTGGAGADTIVVGVDTDADAVTYTSAADGAQAAGGAWLTSIADSITAFVQASDDLRFIGDLTSANLGGTTSNGVSAIANTGGINLNAAAGLTSVQIIAGNAGNTATIGDLVTLGDLNTAAGAVTNETAGDERIFIFNANDTTFAAYKYTTVTADNAIAADELTLLTTGALSGAGNLTAANVVFV